MAGPARRSSPRSKRAVLYTQLPEDPRAAVEHGQSVRSNFETAISSTTGGARVRPGSSSAAAGGVLEGEHHLEQRRVAQVALAARSSSTSLSNGRSWWA